MRNRNWRIVIGRRMRYAAVTSGLAVVLVAGAARTFASTSSSAAPYSGDPEVTSMSYQEPTGPLLPAARVSEIAEQQAKLASESTPTGISVNTTTYDEAVRAEEGAPLPTPSSSGMAAFEASAVDTITMHGHFTLMNARTPPGKSAPEGSVLTVIIDAHTGQLEGRALADEEANGVAAVGYGQGK
jgi:hypothetical protein